MIKTYAYLGHASKSFVKWTTQYFVFHFGKKLMPRWPTQTIATADPHPAALVASLFTQAKSLGTSEWERIPPAKSKIRKPPDLDGHSKRQLNVRGTEFTNGHLADSGEDHMKWDKKPVTAENLLLPVDEKYRDEKRKILRKH